ncbi:MAG: hypothetical protein WDN31_10790 [Hyphomicrobium sp.]
MAEQVPFDRIEQLARETKGQDERQLRLFDTPARRLSNHNVKRG